MRRTVELRTVFVVVIAIAGGGLTSRVLSAAQPTASSDVLAALLSEVKGLRAAIEQMSSASARIQLAVARLQIAEQRINDAGKRLQDVRQRLGDVRRKLQDNENRAAQLDNELQAGNVKEQDREQFTAELTILKREAVPLRATVSESSAEEAQLTEDMAAEQTRWIEISRRLDELDASMTIRK
jgi:septal ring factor EnvC (AmiA/AmiB activator)